MMGRFEYRPHFVAYLASAADPLRIDYAILKLTGDVLINSRYPGASAGPLNQAQSGRTATLPSISPADPELSPESLRTTGPFRLDSILRPQVSTCWRGQGFTISAARPERRQAGSLG
ncbi:hypothetical protein CGK93_09890 [Arthrobacter sp. YN]|nr:hypothetical protein CGK93_09890 [Arthrobacter sp. YN]